MAKLNKEIQIKSSDISVVIQGPIYGKAEDDYKVKLTYQCLKSVRRYLPESEIILSTWKGSDVTGLDYNILVENDDPGFTSMLLNGVLRPNNTNRMIVSTLSGIKKATRSYVLRIRSDMSLLGNGFIQHFSVYNNSTSYKILKEKVLTLSAANPHRQSKYPFAISDWFYFGLKEDILNIYDIPLMKEELLRGTLRDGYYSWEDNVVAEQHIIVSFLRKYRDIKFDYMSDLSNNSIETSEKIIANNFVLLTPELAQLNSLKDPDKKYVSKGFQSLDCYTHNEWKKLYNKYSNGDLLIVPSIKDFIYLMSYHVRFRMQYKCPLVYKKIKNLYHLLGG